jgi:amidase
MTDELASLDATAQAELVRSGEVTPAELVDAALARIDAVDPALNAVIHRFDDKARTVAAGELPDGPFLGVPFLVKDIVCHTAGDPYHCGMQFLKDRSWTAETDAFLAVKLRRAGFVFVGKTNTPELASTVTTEPLAYGATRNPWNTEHSPGGSSGGSAAAVAAGLAPVAHGNDMGGSIRNPASQCGLVGLKPTRARTSLGPSFGEFWGPLTHEGVLTRSVRDTASVLDAIQGPMPGDPYTAPRPAAPFASAVVADPSPLRIGFRATGLGGIGVDEECATAVVATAQLLENLGHSVEEASPAALDEPFADGYLPVFASALARDLDRWSATTGDTIRDEQVEPWNWQISEMGRGVSATDYLAAIEKLQSFSRRVAAWWKYHDVLVLPTVGLPPPKLGVFAPGADLPAVLPSLNQLTQFLIPFNVTGQPAMSLPLATTADGLPIGVQIVGAFGREDVVLALGAQLERAQPWAHRRPAVHA